MLRIAEPARLQIAPQQGTQTAARLHGFFRQAQHQRFGGAQLFHPHDEHGAVVAGRHPRLLQPSELLARMA